MRIDRRTILRAFVIGSMCFATSVASSDSAIFAGEIEGKWQKGDASSENVTMRFHREQTIGHGRIRVRLGADGERFVGEYILMGPQHSTKKLERFHLGWRSTKFNAIRMGPLGQAWVREDGSFKAFRDRTQGQVVATLIGDQSHRMRCLFNLDAPAQGLIGGATGACQTSVGDHVRFSPAEPRE